MSDHAHDRSRAGPSALVPRLRPASLLSRERERREERRADEAISSLPPHLLRDIGLAPAESEPSHRQVIRQATMLEIGTRS